jgi:uncharacterized protein YbaP (TraB family)
MWNSAKAPLAHLLRRLLLASLAAGGLLALPAHALDAGCPQLPASALAPAPAADRGLLWRLSKNGRVSYLYATLHLGRPAWQPPGPRLSEALRASQVLALEIDASDAATQQELAALSAAATGPQPDAALREALQRRMRAACLPPQALAGLHPLMQAMTLTLLEARRDGLDAGFGAEQLLLAQARALRMRVVALETARVQLELLLPSDPGEALAQTRQLLDQLERDSARPVMRRLVEAWERGDLEDLARYEQWCDCAADDSERTWLRRLNDERNPALAAGIAALHEGGTSVFAAVGALHMTGPQALPKLLTLHGFGVERIELAR